MLQDEVGFASETKDSKVIKRQICAIKNVACSIVIVILVLDKYFLTSVIIVICIKHTLSLIGKFYELISVSITYKRGFTVQMCFHVNTPSRNSPIILFCFLNLRTK